MAVCCMASPTRLVDNGETEEVRSGAKLTTFDGRIANGRKDMSTVIEGRGRRDACAGCVIVRASSQPGLSPPSEFNHLGARRDVLQT